jgi:hypothetical protein
MPLSFTPLLLRLKLYHARDQWHSSRAFAPLTGWHCKLRPNTEGNSRTERNANPNPNPDHQFCPNAEGRGRTDCIHNLTLTLTLTINSAQTLQVSKRAAGIGSAGR